MDQARFTTQAKRRPSMQDVARLAGVSQQTVSRVANGEKYVVPDKRERVFAAMRELGYRPNSAARAMKRGSFRTIGVLVDSLHSVGTRSLVEHLGEAAAERGYTTTLIPLRAARTDDDGAFTRLGEMTVDALVAVLPSKEAEDQAMGSLETLPTVVIGRPGVSGTSTVDVDQREASAHAVNRLLELGHSTVHHLGGPPTFFTALEREEAWRQALGAQGRPVPPVERGDWTPGSGYQAMRRLLDQDSAPTAVFVANDQMALGAYRAIAEAGLSIPDDISVIGFDDIDEAPEFSPPLTTISQDWDVAAHEALRLALAMLEGHSGEVVTLPSRLIVRQSAGPWR